MGQATGDGRSKHGGATGNDLNGMQDFGLARAASDFALAEGPSPGLMRVTNKRENVFGGSYHIPVWLTPQNRQKDEQVRDRAGADHDIGR